MAISTGNHPKALWPGVHSWFGQRYNRHPLECTQIFDVRKSGMGYEEIARTEGFGYAVAKSEGGAVSYVSQNQKDVTRFTHTAYALGYIVTREELDDNLYEKVSKSRSGALADSMRATKETVGANILNRAFDSAYTGGDGKELCATDHPSDNGTYSNELTVAADFSEASLEDMLTQIGQAVDYNGLPIALRAQKLIIPVGLEFEACRVLKSELQSGTANNDINAVRSMGLLPGGYVVNHFLTDTDAWFVTTDAQDGLIMFARTAYSFTKDNDFDTDNAKAKAYERYSFGWADPLGVFGSPGA